ncbi:MAG: hypothetical protein ABI680_09025, partial [Chthoniobacteraceae bacterium]
MKLLPLLLVGTICGAAWAAEPSPVTITRSEFGGREAFRLSDGKTEAVIVPSIARVMRYAEVGGENWLWVAADGQVEQDGWKNYGGEKSWVAPQSEWPLFLENAWPPDDAWEGGPQARILENPPRVRTESPVAKNGTRLMREFAYAANGDFVTTTTLEKVSGPALMAGAWTITQIPPVEAIFLPIDRESAYKRGFHRFGKSTRGDVKDNDDGSMIRVTPTTDGAYKIGVDAKDAFIRALRGGKVFEQCTDREEGNYPDGADGAGFPVELYDHGQAEKHYLELEL